jgi:hypothetical protein
MRLQGLRWLLLTPNEIQEYIDARYLSTCEAIWRILEFNIHYRTPSVERLIVYLHGMNNVRFEPNASLTDVLEGPAAGNTMLSAWLFVMIVLCCSVSNVHALFDKYWLYFTDDIQHSICTVLGNPRYVAPHEQLMSLLI